ncbi:hypothetical protein GGI23_005780, partial [Coemansia sp. RSA 2559]
RNISTSQLDSYLDSESIVRTDPALASIVFQLNQQAISLDNGGLPTSHISNSESSVFFNDKAESILRKLVESHVKTEEERMEKERQRELARKAAAQADMVAFWRPQQGPVDAASSASVDKRTSKPRRVRINIDSYSDPESDADEAIGNNGGGETDDDIEDEEEEEEDADFEAPAQSRQAEENLQRLISDPRVGKNRILPNESSHAKRQRSSAAKTIDETEDMAVVNTETSQSGLVSTTATAETAETAGTNRQNDKHNVHRLLQTLFPPANFRNVHKRTQLTSFMH